MAENRSGAAKKTKASAAFKQAKSKAEEYVKDSDKLNELIDKASKKATHKIGALSTVWTQLTACFRLIRAYAKGTYRDVPWYSIVMIVASVIYFVMPIDLIPDFIVGFGLLDDAALLGWTVKTFSTDIDNFLEWESGRPLNTDIEPL